MRQKLTDQQKLILISLITQDLCNLNNISFLSPNEMENWELARGYDEEDLHQTLKVSPEGEMYAWTHETQDWFWYCSSRTVSLGLCQSIFTEDDPQFIFTAEDNRVILPNSEVN